MCICLHPTGHWRGVGWRWIDTSSNEFTGHCDIGVHSPQEVCTPAASVEEPGTAFDCIRTYVHVMYIHIHTYTYIHMYVRTYVDVILLRLMLQYT